MTDELEKMWKKVLMTYFKVPSQHSPGRSEKTHEKFQDDQCPGL
jgi:hypothetical protein